MTHIVEKLNESLERLKNQSCLLNVDGPISFSTKANLLDFNINECFELKLEIQNISLNINLSEMYSYKIEEENIKLFLDGGNIVTLLKA